MTLQPTRLLTADIELWATGYLRAALEARSEPYAADVHVDRRKTAENLPRIVAVRRDGGSSRGVFDFPRLTLRTWCDDEDEAADLARLVHALLLASPGDGFVVAATSLSEPVSVPDESQAQRLSSMQLRVRAGEL